MLILFVRQVLDSKTIQDFQNRLLNESPLLVPRFSQRYMIMINMESPSLSTIILIRCWFSTKLTNYIICNSSVHFALPCSLALIDLNGHYTWCLETNIIIEWWFKVIFIIWQTYQMDVIFLIKYLLCNIICKTSESS